MHIMFLSYFTPLDARQQKIPAFPIYTAAIIYFHYFTRLSFNAEQVYRPYRPSCIDTRTQFRITS